MGIVVAILFVLQLLSFYFIVLLNMKLSKFKDLERKQEQLMSEMDDVISAYLLEMHEENDRLIEELSKKQPPLKDDYKDREQASFSNTNIQTVIPLKKNNKVQLEPLQQVDSTFDMEARALVPKTVAAKAYAQQKVPANQTQEKQQTIQQTIQQAKKSLEDKKIPTYEEQVIQLAKEGKSAEQIAKIMQKGKTEIELLLKFHA